MAEIGILFFAGRIEAGTQVCIIGRGGGRIRKAEPIPCP